jgi:hypothetical protein
MHGEKLAGNMAVSGLLGEVARVRFKPRIRIIELAGDVFNNVAASHLRIESWRGTVLSRCLIRPLV